MTRFRRDRSRHRFLLARGSRTRDAWPIYPTLTAAVHEASDHAALYADVDL